MGQKINNTNKSEEIVMTNEEAVNMIKNDPLNIRVLPQKFKTYENYLMVVGIRGYMLNEVPIDFITSEMCETAIENDYRAYRFIPDDLRTEEFHEIFLRNLKRDETEDKIEDLKFAFTKSRTIKEFKDE